MCPIVSACGTATYQLAKFLTKILQRYTGITPSFVKDSKSFSDHLRMVKISGEEELVLLWRLCIIYQHTCSNSLGRHQQAVHLTHRGTQILRTSMVAPSDATPLDLKKMKLWVSWNWSWKTVSSPSRIGSTNSYMVPLWVLHVLQ